MTGCDYSAATHKSRRVEIRWCKFYNVDDEPVCVLTAAMFKQSKKKNRRKQKIHFYLLTSLKEV